jgi:hypothetical protein
MFCELEIQIAGCQPVMKHLLIQGHLHSARLFDFPQSCSKLILCLKSPARVGFVEIAV